MTEEEDTGLEALGLSKADGEGERYKSIPASKTVERAEELEPGDRVFLETSMREYKCPYNVEDITVEEWQSPMGGWKSVRIEMKTTDFRKGDDPPLRIIEATEGSHRYEGAQTVSWTPGSSPHSVRKLTPAIPEE